MPTGRRSPCPADRKRDAERSRQLLLDAALREFAAKGFAGARTADIAEAAGLNKQLISYYFGGKEGLYQQLHRRWQEREAAIAGPDVPLTEAVTRYLHAALADPCPARLMLWQGLAGDGSPEHADDDIPAMNQARDRGELAADLDQAAVLLAITGMVLAPVAMPHVARRVLGAEPGSTEFEHRYGEQLRLIVGRLSSAPDATDAVETPPPAE